jgi:hypothetical protein
MSRDVICWPTSSPVCFAAYEDSAGDAVTQPFMHPRNLDWRKAESGTYWPMALQRARDRMAPEVFCSVETVGDPMDRKIRVGWPWQRDAAPTHFLQCYDTSGDAAKYAPESISATLAKDSDPERSVFTYLVLDSAEDGRQRVALRCRHGRVAQLSKRFQHAMLTADLVNEPGVAVTVDQPVLRSWVEVITVHEPDASTPGVPAIDYRARLVNPTGEVLQKQFTFTHQKATTGTWNNEVGQSLSMGASVEVSGEAFGVGVSSEFHWEMTADARRSWGSSETETQTVEDATTVNVPPSTALDVHILAQRRRVDVPFDYRIHRIGLDGEELTPVEDTGVYEKVQTLGTDVTIENVTTYRQGT